MKATTIWEAQLSVTAHYRKYCYCFFSYLELFNFAVTDVESSGGKRNLSGDLRSSVALHWLGRVTAASSWASGT